MAPASGDAPRRPSFVAPSAEERLARINECFLSFGPEPDHNIQRLTAACGELCGADWAVYYRLDGPGLSAGASWNAPQDVLGHTWGEGHPSFDVILAGTPEPTVISEFEETAYAALDPIYQRLGVRGYMGQLVSCGSRACGAIALFYRRPHAPSDEDRRFIKFVAAAIGVEEDRRRAVEAVRESRGRSDMLFDRAPIGMALLSFEGVLGRTNDSFQGMLGYTGDELMGNALDLFIHPEDLGLEAGEPARVLDGQKPSYRVERRYRRKDGATIWAAMTAAPIKDPEGRVLCWLGMFEDTTERKVTDEALRRSEAMRLQSQKMEAVGRLAGGVAHDFNNLLTAIWGFSDMLSLRMGEDEEFGRDVAEIQRAAKRGSALTRQLLAFSRQQVLQPRVLDLNDVVDDMEVMLKRLISERIELAVRRQPALACVKADPGQLEQVLLNLVVNARDAMAAGGRIEIETADVSWAADDALRPHDVPAGDWVRLRVRDTGCGMDEATLRRIFEPFFTTKDEGKGTGLGLATVYGIVHQAEGVVHVESASGEGSTFDVYLPKVEVPRDIAPSVDEDGAPVQGTENVLVIEDDDVVRQLACKILRSRGYQVLEASRWQEALRFCETHTAPIHLLLADVIMPGMDGVELSRRVQELRAETKVLYVSGYAGDTPLIDEVAERGLPFLQKPFAAETLARKVRDVLEGPAPSREPEPVAA